MLDELRKTTASSHQALEGFLIPVIKNTFTVAEYSRLLRMFYGYYKPLEEQLDQFAMNEVLPDYDQRRKAQLILDDLHQLGQEEAHLPLCTNLPSIQNRDEALGALYVLEGSTLGGPVIKKILQRNLQRQEEEGFSFFAGYREKTQERWEAFKMELENHSLGNRDSSRVAAAASDTFIYLKRWAELSYNYEPAKEKL